MTSTASKQESSLVEKWVRTLWPELNGEWLSIFAQTADGQQRQTLWAQDPATAAARIAPLIDSHNVWLGCATRRTKLDRGRRGGPSDCVRVPGLWLDIDIKGPAHAATNLPETVDQALEAIDAFPVAPSIIVHSGNGLQPWWLFAEPIEVAEATTLLEDWAWTWEQILDRYGWQLDGVFDLARVLRVPGTLNHKTDPPKAVTIQDLTKVKYGVDDIDQYLQTAPPAPAPAARPATTPYIGPTRPGDHFNMVVSGGQILAEAGWTLVRTDRNGDEHYRHPASTNPTSATVYADDGHTTIWTTSIPQLEARRPYDPFGLYAALRHGSRFSEARATLLAAGYGSRTDTDDVLQWVADSFGADAPARAVVVGGDLIVPPDPTMEQLWAARPTLQHIRDAAHARMLPGEAVLGAVLCRIAFMTPPILRLPAIVGSAGSLDVIHAIVGPSGLGKSQAMRCARDLVPTDNADRDGMPIGSGEGLIEAYYGMAATVDDTGKPVKERKQVHTAVLFEVDEGQVIAEIGARTGSTLLTNLRSAWSGAAVGQTNASGDRTRLLKAGAYRFAMLVGLQPEKAEPLLSDQAGGTPQRFVWFSAVDPTMPTPATRPEWPGPLGWTTPMRGMNRSESWEFDVDDAIVEEIVQARYRLVTTGDSGMGSHAHLARLKLAGLLALVEGSTLIEVDDWELAGIIQRRSDQIVGHMQATIDAERAERRRRSVEAAIGQTVGVEEGLEQKALESMAGQLARKVWRDDELDVSRVAKTVASKWRKHASVHAAVDLAEARGWVEKRSAIDGVVLVPGAVDPHGNGRR